MYAKTEVGNMGLKLQEAKEHFSLFYLLAAVFLGGRDYTANTFFDISAPLLRAAPFHCCYKISTTVNSSSEAPQKLILYSASGHLCAPTVWDVARVLFLFFFQGNRYEQEKLLKQSSTLYVGNLSFYTTEEQVRRTASE